MSRPQISKEQKKAEGLKLKKHIEAAQVLEPRLTQDSLAAEMGVSQGLIAQWVGGSTAIPDKRLVWLGARLRFNPVDFRPSIGWIDSRAEREGATRLSQVIQQIPPGKEDYIADILAPILEALKGNR